MVKVKIGKDWTEIPVTKGTSIVGGVTKTASITVAQLLQAVI